MLETKKIKEIKNYAKTDIKWWVRDSRKERSKEALAEYKKAYPRGITSYYEEVLKNTEDRKERLKSQFGYTDKILEERAEVYHEAFWSSWKWWEAKMVEDNRTMTKYQKIFQEAEAIAKGVDVLDIKDGFPCGSALLYLKPEAKDTDLGKALRRQFDGDSYSAKVCHWSAYKLPIKIPRYGQCMSFDERICERVAEFLNSKNIPTGVYSMID